MKINIIHHHSKAKEAVGLTVVIDVLRAFTTSCYVLANGAEKIIPVGEVDVALELGKNNPDYILMGERYGEKYEGADYGNSPYKIKDIDLGGKTVVLTTTSGTQGIVKAINADEIITGSFVNIEAVIQYIQQKNPEYVSLLCTYTMNPDFLNEDEYCAEYIKAKLEGKDFSMEGIAEELSTTAGKRFFIKDNRHHSPKEDFFMCMELNSFDFVIRAEKDPLLGLTILKKI